MRFNKKKFMEDQSLTMADAAAMLDAVIEILNDYVCDDFGAGGWGYGCYSEPEKHVRGKLEKHSVSEYIT